MRAKLSIESQLLNSYSNAILKSILVIALLAISGFVTSGFSQEAKLDTLETKVDTLIGNQRIMLQNQAKILKEVVYANPLTGKSFGIEFNPALALLASANGSTVLSGGFSLFSVNRRAEIAFPIFYQNLPDQDRSSLTIDSHYRFFFGKGQGGFYLSGSVRYNYAKGKEANVNLGVISFSTGETEIITVNRFGAGFGIGYRYFSRSGLYWGTSLTIGRYFTGTDKLIDGESLINGKGYFDIELLKFGFAF